MVVLGHAEYYPRFGFRQATEFGIHHPEFDGPNLMALALDGARRTGRAISAIRSPPDAGRAAGGRAAASGGPAAVGC